MARMVQMTIHFMDKTRITFKYPKQAGTDTATITANVQKALSQEKIVVEVGDDLFVIPARNIKYIQVSPKPDALPSGILRGASIVG
jgi:hypothetical protein